MGIGDTPKVAISMEKLIFSIFQSNQQRGALSWKSGNHAILGILLLRRFRVCEFGAGSFKLPNGFTRQALEVDVILPSEHCVLSSGDLWSAYTKHLQNGSWLGLTVVPSKMPLGFNVIYTIPSRSRISDCCGSCCWSYPHPTPTILSKLPNFKIILRNYDKIQQ